MDAQETEQSSATETAPTLSSLRQMCDLLALTALPALWVGNSPQQIANSLAEALLNILAADVVYVGIHRNDERFEAARIEPRSRADCPLESLRLLFADQIAARRPEMAFNVQIPGMQSEIRALYISLGLTGMQGDVVVASARPDFPTEMDRLLCGFASNQAVVALKETSLRLSLEQSNRAMQEALTMVETITSNASACLFLINGEGNCTFMNAAAERTFGYSFEELHGKVLHHMIHRIRPDGTDYPIEECPLANALANLQTIRMHEDVFVRKDGTFVPVLCAASPVIHAGERIATVIEAHDITERKIVEEESLRAARRETFIGQIGLAIRSAADPKEVEQIASRLLGEALGADRCFFAYVDLPNNYIRFDAGWSQPGVPSIEGEFQASAFGIDIEELFAGGRPLVVLDTQAPEWPAQTRAALASIGIRSVLDIPFYRDGRLSAILCAAMAAEPRQWTDDEVALAEALATLARNAIDAAALADREHRIATVLQTALQPPAPARTPGLDIAAYYEAALNESSIGGDFYLAHPLDKDRTALVIGDVSGKGLRAASQVAMIQNMLRFAMASIPDLGSALSELNRIVVEQNLLAGFATAFAGIYHRHNGLLSYVSCGHEAPIVRRASGLVEKLPNVGMPLGIEHQGIYDEHTVHLEASDALILYTDGISEAGPNRRELLGSDGLARIVAGCGAGSAQEFVAHIIERAREFAQWGFTDDVCLLTAVVASPRREES